MSGIEKHSRLLRCGINYGCKKVYSESVAVISTGSAIRASLKAASDGATTLSIMTFSITTLSIMTFSIIKFSIMQNDTQHEDICHKEL